MVIRTYLSDHERREFLTAHSLQKFRMTRHQKHNHYDNYLLTYNKSIVCLLSADLNSFWMT